MFKLSFFFFIFFDLVRDAIAPSGVTKGLLDRTVLGVLVVVLGVVAKEG